MIRWESFSLGTDLSGQPERSELQWSRWEGSSVSSWVSNVCSVFVAKSKEGETTNSEGPNTELCRTPGCDVEYLSWTDDHQREED